MATRTSGFGCPSRARRSASLHNGERRKAQRSRATVAWRVVAHQHNRVPKN
jgi:hypothetical protein